MFPFKLKNWNSNFFDLNWNLFPWTIKCYISKIISGGNKFKKKCKTPHMLLSYWLLILFSMFQPQTEGYIAIVLPRLDEPALGTHNLLTEEQYQEKLKERQSETQNIWNFPNFINGLLNLKKMIVLSLDKLN